jgi:hypothetical protein
MNIKDLKIGHIYNYPSQYSEPKKLRYLGFNLKGGTWHEFSEEMCFKNKIWIEMTEEEVCASLTQEDALEATLVIRNKNLGTFDRWGHSNTVILFGDRRQCDDENLKPNKEIPLEILSVKSLKESHPEVYYEILEDYFNNKYGE